MSHLLGQSQSDGLVFLTCTSQEESSMDLLFLLYIVSVAFTGATGQQVEPEVFSYPGQTVNLSCTFTDTSGIQITQVKWFYQSKEGGQIQIAALALNLNPFYPDSPVKGRVSFSSSPPNLTNPSIQIRDVRMSDEGNYTCQYSFIEGEDTQDVTFLDMLEKIENASVTSSTNQPVEGNSVNLTCEAAGSVFTRKWMKNGADLIQTDNMILYNESRVLSFQPLKKTDSGKYSCIISNPLSSVEAEYMITVNYGPENVQIKGPSTINLNMTLTLTCSAESTPSASYTWKLNKTEILNNSAVFTKHITDLSDSGEYTCEAMNSITKRTSSAVRDLTVTLYATVQPPQPVCSAGCIAGIVIACCVVIGVCVLLLVLHKKKKLCKKSSNRDTGTRTGGGGQNNTAYSGNQDVNYADISFFQNKGGGIVQLGSQNNASEYAQVKVNNRPPAPSSPPTYDAHMQRMTSPAPQFGANDAQTYAQVRVK